MKRHKATLIDEQKTCEEIEEIIRLAGDNRAIFRFVSNLAEFFDKAEIVLILRAAKESGLLDESD